MGGNIKELKAVASANSEFSTVMLNGLKQSHPHNLIYSSFSLGAVVAMAKMGARGITATEIAQTLRFPPDDEVLAKGYSRIMTILQGKNLGYTLTIANRLYANVGITIEEQFAKTVKDNFLAEVEQLDFLKSVEAAKTINSWVEATTNGKIKNLVDAELLKAATGLILVNGVYFKGTWEHRFERRSTKKANFFLNASDKVKVDMMNEQYYFGYAEFPDLDAKAVALPYKGDTLVMIVIAPNSKTGLGRIEKGLKDYPPERILMKLSKNNPIDVRMPRFKLECTMSLGEMLQELGASTMFVDGKADFTGISRNGQLSVSEVVQKNFIDVNEDGTEAAAATRMSMMSGCAAGGANRNPKIPIPFRADRPFLFQVVDRQLNLVLFEGRCSNPLKQ